MSSKFAPIVFFAFNRPRHTSETLQALAANSEAIDTDLYVFVDGPRNEADRASVAEVQRVAESAKKFRKVQVTVANSNLGLYRSITNGVSHVISVAGRAIIIEDDILVSPFFLKYMNQALERYECEPRVGSIHGYTPPITGLPDFFFYPRRRLLGMGDMG